MPSLRRLLRHQVTIQRPSNTPAADTTDWNTEPQVYADQGTVPALVQERTGREVALSHEQGSVVVTALVFFERNTDVTERDRLYRADNGRTYEVLYVKDAAGQGHHLEVDAELVRP